MSEKPGDPPEIETKREDDDEPAPLSVTQLPARVWPPKTLGDLMTRKIITVEEHEPIGELEVWMQRFRFHHLPVVTKDMRLVGLITRTDLLHGILGVSPAGEETAKANEATHAGAVMRRGVVTGTPETPLLTACRVMLQEKLGCLPVVLEDKTLVGIVTQTDVLRLAIDALERG